MPIPYNIENPNEGAYRFKTDTNLIYWVTFQPIEFPNSGKVYSFSFYYEGNGRKTGVDVRIEATIVKILQDFWQNDSNVVFIVCETDRNSPGARMRWYQRAEMRNVVQKYDIQYDGEDLSIFSSLLFHCENPLAQCLINDFQMFIDVLKG